MVRLTDRPDMTLDVYRGRKTTMQQQIIVTSEVTAQGSRYQEVCTWTFILFTVFPQIFPTFSVCLLIFLNNVHISQSFVLAFLVHLDKQGL